MAQIFSEAFLAQVTMAAISGNRPNTLQTAIVSMATFAALVLLGVVVAGWTWQWLAPAAEPPAPASPGTVDAAAARNLFGISQGGRTSQVAAGTSIKLLGVAAASAERSGHAVLQIEAGKAIAVRTGGEISPGISLAEVHPDHVVLDRNGKREMLEWPQKKR